jgi:hypothetical protein
MAQRFELRGKGVSSAKVTRPCQTLVKSKDTVMTPFGLMSLTTPDNT